ncbi:hypothetical protein DL98DRAFT_570230 [Cadophora sp. DSE1049]|nr:hypothetical protein DL98DRAFT_570230 [Cadophora sp. DSE1049]
MEPNQSNNAENIVRSKTTARQKETVNERDIPTVTPHLGVPRLAAWEKTPMTSSTQLSGEVQTQVSIDSNEKRHQQISKKRKISTVEKPFAERSAVVGHSNRSIHLPFSRIWINTTATSFPNSSRSNQMDPPTSIGSQPQTPQTELSPYHRSYVGPQTQRPTLSLLPPQQPPNQSLHGPSTVSNSQALVSGHHVFNLSSSPSSDSTPRAFQSFQEYQRWVRENEDPPTASQTRNQTQQPSLRTESTSRRTISQPNQAAAASIQDRLPSQQSIASPLGPLLPHFRSMEEYQRWLSTNNGSAVPQAQIPPQQPYSSPYPPIIARQPSQMPTINIQGRPTHPPGPSIIAGSGSSGAPGAQDAVFKISAIPAYAKPHQQSLLGINQILAGVMETLELAKVETNTLKSKPSLNAPGLAGRGTRLSVIHAQAKVVGCEYFLAELRKSIPQNLQGDAEDLSSPKSKYRLQLSVNLMQIGVATKDLVTYILLQIDIVKKDLATRINNAAVAAKNIQNRHKKETVDIYRAWSVEVAEHAARIFFLQRCLDGLGPRFLNWEEKARVEEKSLPQPEPAGSWDNFPGSESGRS